MTQSKQNYCCCTICPRDCQICAVCNSSNVVSDNRYYAGTSHQSPELTEKLPWRKNLKELVEKFPTQLENALDSAWLQGFEDKGELPENWEKEIQTGYEKLIAIIHEAHDNGLISGRLYKKFGDNFNEIVRSHLNSRELHPAIGVKSKCCMGGCGDINCKHCG